MTRGKNFLQTVVIVHGKSELQICQFIRMQLRIKMEIESDKNGEKSIQITSLMNRLNGGIFKTKTKFLKRYEDELDYDKKNKVIKNFKVFIIMDTDDCTAKEKENFLRKHMFKEHWMYDYIIPVFNSPNLEEVLVKANIKFERKGEERKKEYVKIFPTKKSSEVKEKIQLEDFKNDLKKIEDTNLNEFIEWCLDLRK